jgi:hypothetical protein
LELDKKVQEKSFDNLYAKLSFIPEAILGYAGLVSIWSMLGWTMLGWSMLGWTMLCW